MRKITFLPNGDEHHIIESDGLRAYITIENAQTANFVCKLKNKQLGNGMKIEHGYIKAIGERTSIEALLDRLLHGVL